MSDAAEVEAYGLGKIAVAEEAAVAEQAIFKGKKGEDKPDGDVTDKRIRSDGEGTLAGVFADNVGVTGKPAGKRGDSDRNSQSGKGQRGKTDAPRDKTGRGGRNGTSRSDNAATGKSDDRTPDAGRGNEAEGNGNLNIPKTNFKITDEVDLGSGGATTKYKDNIAAIKTLKALEAVKLHLKVTHPLH